MCDGKEIFATRSSHTSASDLQISESESLIDRDVYLRIRPTTNPKKVPLVPQNSNTLIVATSGSGNRTFSFTKIFNENSTQTEVFNDSVRKRVVDFINGKSSTILTYGMFLSAKTHTMYGTLYEPGIVPHAIRLLFSTVRCTSEPWYKVTGDDMIVALNEEEQVIEEKFKREKLDSSKNTLGSSLIERFLTCCESPVLKCDNQEYSDEMTSMWISAISVETNKVYDMLDSTSDKKLSIRQDGSAYVPDLKFMHISTAAEAYQFLIGSRLLNEHGRSGDNNKIFTIKLLKYRKKNAANTASVSTITFCDIADVDEYSGIMQPEAVVKPQLTLFNHCGLFGRYIKTVYEDGDKAFWPFWESPITLLLRRPLRGQETITFLVTVEDDWSCKDRTVAVLETSSMMKKHPTLGLTYSSDKNINSEERQSIFLW